MLPIELYIKPFVDTGVDSASHSMPVTQPELEGRPVAKWNNLTKRLKRVNEVQRKKYIIRSFAVQNCHKILSG